MKHRINQAAAGILLAVSLPATAEMVSGFNPYVGAEAQYRHMPFEMNYGGNIFKKKYPQANFFVGNRFNEYFGLEFGYNTSKKKTRDVTLLPGQFIAGGDPIPVIDGPNDIHSTSRISGISLSALGSLPVSIIDGLEALGSIGFTRLRVKFIYTEFGNNLVPAPANDNVRTFSGHQALIKLGAGMQYAILENLSVRAMVNWENTKRFQNLKAKESTTPAIKLRNSVVYSFGLKLAF